MKDDHEDDEDSREHDAEDTSGGSSVGTPRGPFDYARLVEPITIPITSTVPTRRFDGVLVVRLHRGQGLVRYSYKMSIKE